MKKYGIDAVPFAHEKMNEWRVKPTLKGDYLVGDLRIGMSARIMDDFLPNYREDRITGSGLVHRDQIVYIGAQRKVQEKGFPGWDHLNPRPIIRPLGYEKDNARRLDEPDFGPNNKDGGKIKVTGTDKKE